MTDTSANKMLVVSSRRRDNNLNQSSSGEGQPLNSTPTARGSLSSAMSSSSGCSSVEGSSSMEPSPRERQPHSAEKEQDQEQGTEELEVNELLYLKLAPNPRKQLIYCQQLDGANCIQGHNFARMSNQNEMSQFSAFSLRKTLRHSQSVIRKPNLPKGQQRDTIRRQHRMVAATGNGACCCCQRQQPTIGRRDLKLVTAGARGAASLADCGPRWRRATIVGRPPVVPQWISDEQPSPERQIRAAHDSELRRATVTPLSTAQRAPRARRSLPVPPPVVPYATNKSLEQKAVESNSQLQRSDEGASIKSQPNDNKEPLALGGGKEGEGGGSRRGGFANIGPEDGGRSSEGIEHSSSKLDLAEGMRLGGCLYSSSAALNGELSLDETSTTSPHPGSSVSIKECSSSAGSLAALGFRGKTGRFFERLRFSFLANFTSLSQATTTTTTTATGMKGLISEPMSIENNTPFSGDEICGAITTTTNYRPESSSSHNSNASSDIYDTPEYDARVERPAQRCDLGSADARVVPRPPMPPPPPPTEPKLAPATSSMRAPQNNNSNKTREKEEGSSFCDCATKTSSTSIANSNQPKSSALLSRTSDCCGATETSSRSRRVAQSVAGSERLRYNTAICQNGDTPAKLIANTKSEQPTTRSSAAKNKQQQTTTRTKSYSQQSGIVEGATQIDHRKRKAVKWAEGPPKEIAACCRDKKVVTESSSRASVSGETGDFISGGKGACSSIQGTCQSPSHCIAGNKQRQSLNSSIVRVNCCQSPQVTSKQQIGQSEERGRNNKQDHQQKVEQKKDFRGHNMGAGHSSHYAPEAQASGQPAANQSAPMANSTVTSTKTTSTSITTTTAASINTTSIMTSGTKPGIRHKLHGASEASAMAKQVAAAISNHNHGRPKLFNSLVQVTKQQQQPQQKTNYQPKNEASCVKRRDDDFLERRRKSIKDGDVFIYPTLYKDLNECQKCSRDNKICSCSFELSDQKKERTKEKRIDEEDAKSPVIVAEGKRKVSFSLSVRSNHRDPGKRDTTNLNNNNNTRRNSDLMDFSTPRVISQQTSTSTNGSTFKYCPDSQSYARHSLPVPSLMDTPTKGIITNRQTSQIPENVQLPTADSESELLVDFKPEAVAAVTCEPPNEGYSELLNLNLNPRSSSSPESICRSSSSDSSSSCSIDCNSDQNLNPCDMNSEVLSCDSSANKATATSISYGDLHSPRPENKGSLTSIVPIQTSGATLTSRRRKLITKLSGQAIYEDSGGDEEAIESEATNGNKVEQDLALNNNYLSPSDKNEQFVNEDRRSDTLDYSPILISVRDYINNMNSLDGQVQSPISCSVSNQLTPDDCTERPSIMSRGTLDLDIGSQSPSVVELKPEAAIVAATNALASASATIASTSQTGTTCSVPNVLLVSGSELMESPKKSIFEGASKDEILEYLEDARERVPEILMAAAEDVMVINGSEMLVVNQLEPDCVAAPIAIVTAADTIAACEETPEISASLATAVSQVTSVDEVLQVNGDENQQQQLRHRLHQMYIQQSDGSRQQNCSSQFSSTNETMDDDTGIGSDQHSGLNSKLESGRTSFDIPLTPNEIKAQAVTAESTGRPLLKTFTGLTGATIESIESNQASMDLTSQRDSVCEPSEIENNLLSPAANNQLNPLAIIHTQPTIITTIATTFSPENTCLLPSSIGSSGFETRYHYSTATSSMPVARRRNSTSSEGSSQLMGGTCAVADSQTSQRNQRTLHLLRLQHRYSNRDSLSSPPSSPPSSASPSSSTSSNRTSGNSAASTFYASSSLSSSSPLLALNPEVLSSSIKAAPYSANNIKSNGLNSGQLDQGHLLPSPGCKPHESQLFLNFLTKKEIVDETVAETWRESNLNNRPSPINNRLVITEESADPEVHLDQQANLASKLDVGNEIQVGNLLAKTGPKEAVNYCLSADRKLPLSNTVGRFNGNNSVPTFSSAANLMSRTLYGHYATMNRLNNYFMNRRPKDNESATIEFQCLDCDQFIDVDHATMMHKSDELRLLSCTDNPLDALQQQVIEDKSRLWDKDKHSQMTSDQLDRAYIAAMNGLPLCKSCEKKRIERKEIISEFVETELRYGRDLKIIHDEFYRPMQIAGLLSKDHINGVFLNLEELIMAHCKFAIRLEAALREAHSMGDSDYNTVNIGRLFVDSAEMLHSFESYCIRQGSAACLLARLAKEKELLRIFLGVSQMENTLLRRMNLAAFLMVPVQRVTKYPLLLNRLYKVTAYHHKDREVLRDAQLKVELHLEHINQQTKGVGSTNKIWRRFSNLSAPISNRRGLIDAEDIGYIKLRKTAMDMLKWDRDETQFIHSGRLNFVPLNEYLIKQKMKPMRYMAAHALLVVLGKPNWKYRPDLVKSTLDYKLMTPTPGGNGIKETALLLFREKGGRFIPCREPLLLSNCVLSVDCSQYNSECPTANPMKDHHNSSKGNNSMHVPAGNNQTNHSAAISTSSSNGASNRGKLLSGATGSSRDSSTESVPAHQANGSLVVGDTLKASSSLLATSRDMKEKVNDLRAHSHPNHSDTISMTSIKSLPEERHGGGGHGGSSSPPAHSSRSFSLASALPRATVATSVSSSASLHKSSSVTSSNLTIINQLMTKVNNFGHKQPNPNVTKTAAAFTLANTDHSTTTTLTKGSVMHLSTTALDSSNVGTQATIRATSAQANNNNINSHNRSTGPHQQHQPNTLTAKSMASLNNNNNINNNNNPVGHQETINTQHYNHLFFHNHNHQPYGDYEESFEIHELLTKESILLRADTPLKTRYWLQMLRYHAKDLGQWRLRRNGLANIMMMRQD